MEGRKCYSPPMILAHNAIRFETTFSCPPDLSGIPIQVIPNNLPLDQLWTWFSNWLKNHGH